MIHIPSCHYEITDDFVTIEQDHGEMSVHLHRMHIEHIARQWGLPVLDASAASFQRRLEAVIDRLANILTNTQARTDILDHCPAGRDILTRLDAVLDLADHLVADTLATTAPPATEAASPAPETVPHPQPPARATLL